MTEAAHTAHAYIKISWYLWYQHNKITLLIQTSLLPQGRIELNLFEYWCSLLIYQHTVEQQFRTEVFTDNAWNIWTFLPTMAEKGNTRKNKQQQKHSAYPSISLRQFYQNCTVWYKHSHTPGFWTQGFEFKNCFRSYNSARSRESLPTVKHNSSALQFVEVKWFVRIKLLRCDFGCYITADLLWVAAGVWCCSLSPSCFRYCLCSCGASVLYTAECTQQSATGVFRPGEKRQPGQRAFCFDSNWAVWFWKRSLTPFGEVGFFLISFLSTFSILFFNQVKFDCSFLFVLGKNTAPAFY